MSLKRSKISFLGRHLMLKKEYADLVLSGIKKATIRLGIIRPRKERILLHSGGKVVAELKITDVEIKRVYELTDEDAKLDGFQNRKQLIKNLNKIYGKVRQNDPVTIIKFELVKKLEEKEESKYLGLKPVDIASIALRYKIELEEEEERVLKKLIETGSIRKTATSLYGSIANRGMVRKVLDSVLKKLVEAGIVSNKRSPS